MKKTWSIIILIAGILSAKTIWASNACPEGEVLEAVTQTCLTKTGDCGDGCTYVFKDGNLTVSGDGTGVIETGAFRNNIGRSAVNVYISGIETIGRTAFFGAGTGGGTVKIDDALRNLNDDSFAYTGFSTFDIDSTNFSATCCSSFMTDNITFIVPPNTQNLNPRAFGNSANNFISNLTIQCKGDAALCAKSLNSAVSGILHKGGTVNMTDTEGNTVAWEENGYAVSDSNGDVIGRYNSSGKMIASYTYNPDGSVLTTEYDEQGAFLKAYSKNTDGSLSLFNEDGKLIGFNGKRIYTVEEAALVTKPLGNTFKIKYR